MEKNQQEIPFEFIEKELIAIRANFRKEASRHFSTLQVDLYERLVFDLTHKDFEYFLCYILEKEFYEQVDVSCKELDQKGADVTASKYDIMHFFQCKQWSSKYIDIKQVGASYGKLYVLKNSHPDSIIHFISTSFLSDDSEIFLKNHAVHYYSNRDIIERAMMYKLHEPEYWIKLIQYIQIKRLKLYNQQRLPIGINEFQQLLEDRLQEETMHTWSYRNCGKVLSPKSESLIFMNFTEGWTTS